MWQHLSAHARPQLWPLDDPEAAAWLWERLRKAFPDALAAALMENHLHLIVDGDPDEARRRLAAVLSGFTRRFGRPGDRIWLPVDAPRAIDDRQKLARQVRYLALNPCRTSPPLAVDPLAWLWSTHRDVMGAVIAPWVTAERLADAIGWARRGFSERWHRYVSADPHVDVGGTPLPVAAVPRKAPSESLEAIARAAAAAVRGRPEEIRSRTATRAVFLQLATRQGWSPPQLAQACGITADAVRGRRLPLAVAAAALCLGDPRLTAQRPRRAPDPSSVELGDPAK